MRSVRRHRHPRLGVGTRAPTPRHDEAHRRASMTSIHRLRTLLLLAASTPCLAQRGDLIGSAFYDANGNGTRDTNERGIPNVVISDQDTVVLTDASGAYRLRRGASRLVFVSAPSDHRAVGNFWRPLDSTTARVDFPLAPTARATEFTFLHASDTHIAPAVLARTQRLRALADSLAPAFVLITGDLVRDALRVGEAEARGYYDLFAREAPLFKSPVWTVPGNHEIFGIERSRSNVSTTHPLYGRAMYHHYRGPDYYSFNVGGVHFVGLNTVDVDDQWYYGHVDSVQLRWLERDLAMLPPATPVVTFNHIPFFSSLEALGGYSDAPPAPTLITVGGKTVFRHTVSNAGAVLAVLRRHQHVLALGGHVHVGEQITYEVDGLRTRFNQSAAIVGPSAGASLQFTSGVTRYRVRNGVIDAGEFIPLGVDAKR